MTRGTGTAATAADSFAREWRAVRADVDIQFTPLQMPPPLEWPDWLKRLGAMLDAVLGPIGRFLGQTGPAVPWIAGAVAVGLAAWLLWRFAGPLVGLRGRPPPTAQADAWQPEAAAALALLEDADRLAAEGRFEEATRLLLHRSVGQIAAARPGLLDPSTTAREITQLPALAEAARGAFAIIAERVEHSVFALRRLSAQDWQTAREAYARFTLTAPTLGPA